MKRVIEFSIVALLLSGALIAIAYTHATDTKDKAVTEKTNYGETVAQNSTLYQNGTMVSVSVKGGSNSKPVGVEIPQSWKNISVEKHEPTEEDWKFTRDSMTNLSEEEKDKLLKEFKEISENKSKLSKEEQIEVCQKIGHYIIEATEGSSVQAGWNETNESILSNANASIPK